MNKRVLLAAAIVGAVASAPASAVTLTVGTGSQGSQFNQTTFTGYSTTNVFDFQNGADGGLAAAGFSTAGTQPTLNIVSGRSAGFYEPPTQAGGNRYVAVYGGGTFQATKNNPGFSLVSLFIGSVDNYNSIDILSTSGAVLASFNGNALAGGTADSVNGRRVTFTAGAGESIGGLAIRSTQNSAEFDNLVFAVPEPSTWALMLAGFGMVGFAMRSRRRRTTTVFA